MRSMTRHGAFTGGVLSPNLGCPYILSLADIGSRRLSGSRGGADFFAVFAAGPETAATLSRQFFDDSLFLQPCCRAAAVAPIRLRLADDLEEITQWNKLAAFSQIHQWRTLIPNELHYNVFGEGTRYWQLPLMIDVKDREELLGRGERLRLFDLEWRPKGGVAQRNYHAVQVVGDFSRCRFYQLSDLHTARRNDEMLEELLQDSAGKDARSRFVNFNQHLRKAIHYVNNAAASGKLDFVLLTGDLVDFANHDWRADAPDDNNWINFLNIVTGRGRESEMPVGVEENGKPVIGNPGFQVAIFTSTGNHDWRLYPYSPKQQHKIFGLGKEEMRSYRYAYFDPAADPEDPRSKAAQALQHRLLKGINPEALSGTSKWAVQGARLPAFILDSALVRYLWYLPSVAVAASPLGAAKLALDLPLKTFWLLALGVPLAAVLSAVARYFLHKIIQKWVNLIVENPLDAGPRALHFYLRHINPYLDYVFSYGANYFVLMDTGADVNNGQVLDPRSLDKIKKMSLGDNIFGGSPDSLAFDARKSYYAWSQIVWLEAVLDSIRGQPEPDKRIIVALHAPPINLNLGKKVTRAEIFEKNHRTKRAHAWVSAADHVLTYGTINDYLSQFFYLCLGLKEYECRRTRSWGWWSNLIYRCRNWCSRHGLPPDPHRQRKELDDRARGLPGGAGALPVDLVLSGHTHRLMEFRLWLDTSREILIYSDFYSERHAAVAADMRPDWWRANRPVIVQTPAIGPNSATDVGAPYFRRVVIEDGCIADFSVRSWQTAERPVALTSGDILAPVEEALATASQGG